MGRKKKSDKKNINTDSLPTAESLAKTPMTAKQLCTWLELMGWDTTEEKLSKVGLLLGRSTRQLRRYTNGTVPVPLSLGLSCLYLMQNKKKDDATT